MFWPLINKVPEDREVQVPAVWVGGGREWGVDQPLQLHPLLPTQLYTPGSNFNSEMYILAYVVLDVCRSL